tara:strand:- start:11086 stop:14910 length:3825 start_codon:yes stop_codon:yes gene_type:complete
MDVYRNLLVKLNEKYNFVYFNTNLKKNVILLRHDIHLQDIENGYKMIEIEKSLGINATYFVQYNIPQESNNNNYQEKYIKFINYCIENNVEVQPHISPISGAFHLDSSLSKEVNDIEKVKKNYLLNRVDNYDEFTIVDDFLEINKLNKTIIKYLNDYNKVWNDKFGFYPKGMSVHGDCTFPKIIGGLNNKTLMNQKCFIDIYEYIDRSHIISDNFSYISDTQYNINLFCPEKFNNNTYQILIHPAQWSGINFETNLCTSKYGFTLENINLNGSGSDKRYLKGGFGYKKDDKWVNELMDKTELFTLDKKLSICDSGCGDGFWCEILNTHFDKVFGEDLSKGGIYMGIKNNITNKTNISYEYCDSLTNKSKYDVIFSRHHGLLCSTQVFSPYFLFNFLKLASRGKINIHVLLKKIYNKDEFREISKYKILEKFFQNVKIVDYQNNHILILKNPIEDIINNELKRLEIISLSIKTGSDMLYFKYQSNVDLLRKPGKLDFFLNNCDIKSYINDCKTLVDIGCGHGVISEILSEYYDVTGEDISEPAIEIAKYSTKKVNYICKSSLDIYDKYDIVFAKGPSFLEGYDVKSEEFKKNLEHLIYRANNILIYITYTKSPFESTNKFKCYMNSPNEIKELFQNYGNILLSKYLHNYYFIAIELKKETDFKYNIVGGKEQKSSRDLQKRLYTVNDKYTDKYTDKIVGNTSKNINSYDIDCIKYLYKDPFYGQYTQDIKFSKKYNFNSFNYLKNINNLNIKYLKNYDFINSENCSYRLDYNRAYLGVRPQTIYLSQFDRDGLLIQSHWSHVDGKYSAGEIQLYGSKDDFNINKLPKLVIYGENEGDKFGESVCDAGDFNGDGFNDLLISAPYFNTENIDGSVNEHAGIVYLVFMKYIDLNSKNPIKIFAKDIGKKIPGIRIEGGFDGSRYLSYQMTLDSGNFVDKNYSSILISTHDIYPKKTMDCYGWKSPAFKPKTYLIHGYKDVPLYVEKYKLGVDKNFSTTTILWKNVPRTTGMNLTSSNIGKINDELDSFSVCIGDDFDISNPEVNNKYKGQELESRCYIFYGNKNLKNKDLEKENADLLVEPENFNLNDDYIVVKNINSASNGGNFNCHEKHSIMITATSTKISGKTTGIIGILNLENKKYGKIRFSELDQFVISNTKLSDTHYKSYLLGKQNIVKCRDITNNLHADLLINDSHYNEMIDSKTINRGRMYLIQGNNSNNILKIPDDCHTVYLPDLERQGMLGIGWTSGKFNGEFNQVALGDHYLSSLNGKKCIGGVYII